MEAVGFILVLVLFALLIACIIIFGGGSLAGSVTQTVHVHGGAPQHPQYAPQPVGMAPDAIMHMLQQAERRHGEQMQVLMHQQQRPAQLPPPPVGMPPEMVHHMLAAQAKQMHAIQAQNQQQMQMLTRQMVEDRQIAHQQIMQIEHRRRAEQREEMQQFAALTHKNEAQRQALGHQQAQAHALAYQQVQAPLPPPVAVRHQGARYMGAVVDVGYSAPPDGRYLAPPHRALAAPRHEAPSFLKRIGRKLVS